MNCVYCATKLQLYPVGKHGFQKIRCPNCKTIILKSPTAIAIEVTRPALRQDYENKTKKQYTEITHVQVLKNLRPSNTSSHNRIYVYD